MSHVIPCRLSHSQTVVLGVQIPAAESLGSPATLKVVRHLFQLHLPSLPELSLVTPEGSLKQEEKCLIILVTQQKGNVHFKQQKQWKRCRLLTFLYITKQKNPVRTGLNDS